MQHPLENRENLIAIFISILSLILFGLLVYSTVSIVSPILLYILIIIVFILNKKQPVVKSIFFLSTIIFSVWFLNELLAVLTPFIFAFIIAYLFKPLVVYLENRNVKSSSGALISILIVLIFALLLISFIVPPFINQIGNLISYAPQKINEIEKFFTENILPELKRLGILYPDVQKTLSTEIPARLQSVLNGLLNGLLNIFSGISFIFNQIINLIVIPVITFYFLRDYDKILNAFLNLFNDEHRSTVKKVGERINKIFGNYIRGYLLISLINGIIITTGLSLIGVPYAIVLGILSALLNFIPYFGMVISVTIGFLISIFSGMSGIKLILVPVVYIGENILESYFISPKIIGESLGLHPLLVLLSLFVFGYFGGLIGMLIGVPITALIISLFVNRE